MPDLIHLFGLFVAVVGAYVLYRERSISSWPEKVVLVIMVVAGLVLVCINIQEDLFLPNGSLAHHVDQGFLWSTMVLARTVPKPERGDVPSPFSHVAGIALIGIGIGDTLFDFFQRNIPLLSSEYLFDLGLLLIGVTLAAQSYRICNKVVSCAIITAGGVAMVASFLLT